MSSLEFGWQIDRPDFGPRQIMSVSELSPGIIVERCVQLPDQEEPSLAEPIAVWAVGKRFASKRHGTLKGLIVDPDIVDGPDLAIVSGVGTGDDVLWDSGYPDVIAFNLKFEHSGLVPRVEDGQELWHPYNYLRKIDGQRGKLYAKVLESFFGPDLQRLARLGDDALSGPGAV